MFTIKSMEEIKNEINGKNGHNFPKTIVFPFDESYKNIVTKIESIEISPECILYNSVEAVNTSKEFSDKSYWNKNITEDEIKNYWFIGDDGQGDYWIIDRNNKIYFYNHDLEEMSPENFIDLNINFEQWLQFAYLNRDLDTIYLDNKDAGKEYKTKLGEISKELMENYPFNIDA